MIVSRFLPLAKVAIRRDFLFGRRWSWMKTAVMGEKSDAVRILVKVWKSLLLPRSEFTFLDTYLGPGCGSIPSSFRFLIHSTDRRRDAVASVHLPFSLARWRASSLSLRVLRRGSVSACRKVTVPRLGKCRPRSRPHGLASVSRELTGHVMRRSRGAPAVPFPLRR